MTDTQTITLPNGETYRVDGPFYNDLHGTRTYQLSDGGRTPRYYIKSFADDSLAFTVPVRGVENVRFTDKSGKLEVMTE